MSFSSRSRRGTLWCLLTICFPLFGHLSRMVYAQSSAGLVLYDNFDERFLDPAKWSPSFGACGWHLLECVREIRDEKLRLAVRIYGTTSSNQDVQFGASELHFSNPTPVKGIATLLTVRRASSLPCPANATLYNSHAHAILQGNFFNSGSGNSDDDVQGLFIFDLRIWTRKALSPWARLCIGKVSFLGS